MFQNRKLNDSINSIKKDVLDLHSSSLAKFTEIFSVKYDLSLHILKEDFELTESFYSFRSHRDYIVCRNVKTIHYDIKSISYLTPKVRGIIPYQIRHFRSLTKFKNVISQCQ